MGALPEDRIVTLRRAVTARLERLRRDLLHYVTWRRREKKLSGYLLRLFVLFVALIVFPILKLVQLGVIGFAMGTLKTFLAAGVVIAGLALGFTIAEFLKRRRRGLSIMEALA
jgi:hypothetical protein